MIRTYSELRRLDTLQERFKYLMLKGRVGDMTFGFDRYINQRFYTSSQWRHVRSYIITRDLGCDLGVEGFDIHSNLFIHHMNPMTLNDIVSGDDSILDPEFLITTTLVTHNAIHYGDERQLTQVLVERRPGDTKLW
jgi:hypothetical protein